MKAPGPFRLCLGSPYRGREPCVADNHFLLLLNYLTGFFHLEFRSLQASKRFEELVLL